MGSRLGLYEYTYKFSMVNEQEINSIHKSYLKVGVRAFLYEIRTSFILKTTCGTHVHINSESFDAFTYDKESDDFSYLSYLIDSRLDEYWMTRNEILSFIDSALSFARGMAALPEHAGLSPIPVVVDLEVRTVQQEKETYDAAMERAIGAHNLVPLYLWPHVSNADRSNPRMTVWLMNFLSGLKRDRVEDVEKGLAVMQVCGLCDRKPCVGAQISVLKCNHAFHPHCIVRLVEETSPLCPICSFKFR